jgi:2-keto-3-deoxy-L-fuconate dehydrogenase
MSADDYAALRVLVTGGASGIDHAVAVTGLRRGATVAVLDLDPASAPASAVALHADVTDDASVTEAVEKTATTMGGIDVLVNNAGIGAQGTIETNSLDEWRHVLDVNVPGIVRVTRSALAHSASVAPRGSRHPVLDRGDRWTPRAGRVPLVKGDRAVADDGNGGRPRGRGHPGQLREPGNGRHSGSVGRSTKRPTRRRAPRPGGSPTDWRLVTADEVATAVLYLGGRPAGSTAGMALAVDGGLSGLRLRHAPTTTWGGDRRIPTLIHRPISDNVVNGDIVVNQHVTTNWGNS